MRTYIVDAFTDEAFKGNPAGVCLLDQSLGDQKMLSIARELGLSETAFVRRLEEGAFAIRYFSPKMEIPLCGHATLAAAKVLFQDHRGSPVWRQSRQLTPHDGASEGHFDDTDPHTLNFSLTEKCA